MSLRCAGTALLAILAAATLAGCYRSEFSLVPDADLTEVAELSAGRFCAAAPDWTGEIAVDRDDCRAFAFDPERRVYVETREWEAADWSLEHRIVKLSERLYLTEVIEPDVEHLQYTTIPFVAAGDGFAAIADVLDDGFGVFADAYSDLDTSTGDHLDGGVIYGGDLQRARVLIELAARDDAAAWAAGEGDPEGVVVYVRFAQSEDDAVAASRYAGVVAALRAGFARRGR